MHSPISWITKTPVGRILNRYAMSACCCRGSLNYGSRFSHDIHAADFEFPFDFLNFATNLLGMSGALIQNSVGVPYILTRLRYFRVHHNRNAIARFRPTASRCNCNLLFEILSRNQQSISLQLTRIISDVLVFQQFQRLEAESKSPVCFRGVFLPDSADMSLSFIRYLELRFPGLLPSGLSAPRPFSDHKTLPL